MSACQWRSHVNSHTMLLGIVLLAGALLRFSCLTCSPPGIWHDEAFYASNAMRMLGGHFQFTYIQYGTVQFGLFPLMLTPGFIVLGDHFYALRAMMAFWGVLGLIGCYGCTRELFHRHPQGRTIALVATALLVASYWHMVASRMAYSSSMVPLFSVFSLWLTLRAFRRESPRAAAAAAFVTSLGFYTYWPFYTFALLPAAVACAAFIRRPRRNTTFWVYVGVGCIIFIPVVHTFITHDMLVRLRSVGMHSNDSLPLASRMTAFASTVAEHLRLHMRMIFLEGSSNLRHSLYGNPQLAALPAGAMIAATAYFLWLQAGLLFRRRANPSRTPLFIAFAWAFLALLPAALSTEGLPHALRSIGMCVPLQIIAATALVQFAQWLRKPLRYWAYGLLAAAITSQSFQTAYLYFTVLPQHPKAYGAYSIGSRNHATYQFNIQFGYAREGEKIREENHQRNLQKAQP